MRPKMGQGKRPRKGKRLTAAASALLATLPLPALAASPAETLDNGRLIVLSALTAGAVALAIAASLWALAEQSNARRLRRSLASRSSCGESRNSLTASQTALWLRARGLSDVCAPSGLCLD